ncbi:MAG TPA: SDR family oxidoreductase [Pseudolabrys sp.]|nr:SDR family oxidoreductase [Pseudolabrys sp.]
MTLLPWPLGRSLRPAPERAGSGRAPVQFNVVVTGASAGVGRATAHRFAHAGARIGLIARDEAALADVQREVEQRGGAAVAAPADVSSAEAVFAAADRLEREIGPIDVWINDAMVTVFSPFSDMTAEEFRRVTEVTYLGFAYGTMAALRLMRPRNRGTIVQVGSSLAYRGIPLQSAYCGAKHAIRGFTNSLRCELIHDRSNVHVTLVNLPAVNTPQFDWARTHMRRQPRPVPPVIEPEVAASAIFRAAHERKREYWLGLSTAEAILGNMFGATWLDRYLARTAYAAQTTGEPLPAGWRDNLYHSVPERHRTRGSFGSEAAKRAPMLPAPATRVAAVATGVVAAGVLVVLGQRLLREL